VPHALQTSAPPVSVLTRRCSSWPHSGIQLESATRSCHEGRRVRAQPRRCRHRSSRTGVRPARTGRFRQGRR